MRKTVRLFSEIGPEERLGRAITSLPRAARQALREVADREDLPLVAGTWRSGDGGCLVANVVATLDAEARVAGSTLDVRVLRLLPELGGRELNELIVAWDEAAEQEGRSGDAALRRLLRGGLAFAAAQTDPGPQGDRDYPPGTPVLAGVSPSVTSTVASSPSRT